MIRYFIIICFALFSMNSLAQIKQSPEITTYYFIRHAEKDRSNPSEPDVHLTQEGLERAQHWNDILQHIRFDAVYATDFNRTKETAQPTARKNNLEIITYSVNESYNAAFKSATQGKTILIVGHSNTIPNFVNAVIGNKKYDEIDDAINGNLYIVTIIGDVMKDMLLTIN